MTRLSPDHARLQKGFSRLLDASVPAEVITRCYDEDEVPREFWEAAGKGGWLALLDDAGLNLLGVAALAEEVGSRLMPGPFATTVAYTVPLLRELGADKVADRVGEGAQLVAAALPEPSWNDERLSWGATLQAELDSTYGGVIVGRAQNVAYLAACDAILLVVDCSDGLSRAVLADPHDEAITITAGARLDPTRPVGQLDVSGLRVSGDDWLGGPGRSVSVEVALAMPRALVISDAEAIGGMRELVRRAVEYASERRQFGVPIGSFQAIKHQLADAEIALQVARVMVQRVAIDLDSGGAQDVDHLAARLLVVEAYAEIAETVIQCFGGYGFTWDAAIHRWYRRALLEQAQPIALRDLRDLLGRAISRP